MIPMDFEVNSYLNTLLTYFKINQNAPNSLFEEKVDLKAYF